MSNIEPLREATDPGPESFTREDYVRLRRKLWKDFERRGVPGDMIEDFVHQTFLRAEEALPTFEGRASFDTWVVSIAKTVWLKHKRRRRTLMRRADEVSLDQDDSEASRTRAALEAPQATPETRAAAREDLRQVWAAIRELAPTHQQPLLLQAEGYTTEQIGNLLGIPPDRASSRIFEARAKLRQMFPGRIREKPR